MKRSEDGELPWRLVLEAMVFQAEAELRWLDHCETSLLRDTPARETVEVRAVICADAASQCGLVPTRPPEHRCPYRAGSLTQAEQRAAAADTRCDDLHRVLSGDPTRCSTSSTTAAPPRGAGGVSSGAGGVSLGGGRGLTNVFVASVFGGRWR